MATPSGAHHQDVDTARSTGGLPPLERDTVPNNQTRRETTLDKVRIYSTTGACLLAQTTREAVRHLQRIEVWFAKVGRYHERWSEAEVATLAIISHVVRDLGLRVNAISSFAEDIWRICVDHDCTELMSKRIFMSTIDL